MSLIFITNLYAGEQPVLMVKNPPIPFAQHGKTALAYELFVSPPCGGKTEITKVEVLRDGSGGEMLLKYEGEELKRFNRIADNRIRDDVVFLWITIEKGQKIPKQLYHRVIIANTEKPVEGSPVKISKEPAPVIGAPLRGKNWVAANGPSDLDMFHRGAILSINNRPLIGQRFATDFVKLGADGKLFKDKGKHNKDYPCYGEDLLAVADGIIADTKDGIPENEPVAKRAVDITMGTLGGNYVVLKIGKNQYAFYAHLIPGSLRVKIGDKVKKGDVLGLLGNSGNSDAPHLHFHVCNGMDFLFSEGVPYRLDSYVSKSPPQKFERDIMSNGDVVSFE